jgi:hypothetical protein
MQLITCKERSPSPEVYIFLDTLAWVWVSRGAAYLFFHSSDRQGKTHSLSVHDYNIPRKLHKHNRKGKHIN